MTSRTQPPTLPISVVVPVRNAEAWVESCLRALRDARPAEIIVVDGSSTDGTTQIAAALADRVVDDRGTGVAAARQLGLTMASQEWVMFVDVDVVVAPDTLARLLAEARERGLDGLQAGLRSVGEGDYWSEALAEHHNRGHVRTWFGVCATLVRRDLLLRHPLDETFRSGEDVDLRLRLEAAGEPIGVSQDVIVEHRFASGFEYARGQFVADGAGLGRLVRRHGPTAVPRAILPFGAAVLGILGLLLGRGRLVPYWAALAVYNALGLVEGLSDGRVSPAWMHPDRNHAQAGQVSAWAVFGILIVSLAALVAGILLELAGIIHGLGRFLRGSPLPVILTAVVVVVLVAAELTGSTEDAPTGSRTDLLVRVALGGAAIAFIVGGIRFAYIIGLLA